MSQIRDLVQKKEAAETARKEYREAKWRKENDELLATIDSYIPEVTEMIECANYMRRLPSQDPYGEFLQEFLDDFFAGDGLSVQFKTDSGRANLNEEITEIWFAYHDLDITMTPEGPRFPKDSADEDNWVLTVIIEWFEEFEAKFINFEERLGDCIDEYGYDGSEILEDLDDYML